MARGVAVRRLFSAVLALPRAVRTAIRARAAVLVGRAFFQVLTTSSLLVITRRVAASGRLALASGRSRGEAGQRSPSPRSPAALVYTVVISMVGLLISRVIAEVGCHGITQILKGSRISLFRTSARLLQSHRLTSRSYRRNWTTMVQQSRVSSLNNLTGWS